MLQLFILLVSVSFVGLTVVFLHAIADISVVLWALLPQDFLGPNTFSVQPHFVASVDKECLVDTSKALLFRLEYIFDK